MSLTVCDKHRTAELLPFADLVDAIAQAANEYEAGVIASPERLVVPMGVGGLMLSMPATAPDVGVHKLVNVQPANSGRQRPTIYGLVTVCDAATGEPLFVLDGTEVTGRRTAAVSLLAIRCLLANSPREALVIGTGAQARFHVQALAAMHPQCKVWVRGMDAPSAQRFSEEVGAALGIDVEPCAAGVPDGADAIITVTTSTQPVYDEAPRAGRVVIGVGAFKPDMAELGATTLGGSDLYVDDAAGARHEAGDLLRAGIDWNCVTSLGTLLKRECDFSRPAVFKSVGTAAWDLAAGRVALRSIKRN